MLVIQMRSRKAMNRAVQSHINDFYLCQAHVNSDPEIRQYHILLTKNYYNLPNPVF